MVSRDELISIQENAIKAAQDCISLLKNIEVGSIYYVEGYKGRDEVIRVTAFGHEPEVRGVLLASRHKDPLDDPLFYSRWLKFIDKVTPFDQSMSPLCINWEFISPEFKTLFFK